MQAKKAHKEPERDMKAFWEHLGKKPPGPILDRRAEDPSRAPKKNGKSAAA